MIPLEAILDNVLLDPEPDEGTAAGGRIILPDGSRKPLYRGTVMSCGPDVKYVSEGDRVFYAKYHGTMFDIARDQETVVVRAGTDCCEVLGKIVGNRIIPVRDHVFVDAYAPLDKKGGIFIPERDRFKMFQGTVIAVGPESHKAIKVLDHVVWTKWSGYEYEWEGQKFLVLRGGNKTCEILGHIKPGKYNIQVEKVVVEAAPAESFGKGTVIKGMKSAGHNRKD